MRDPREPNKVLMVLIWYSAVLPPEKERQANMAALRADLAEALAWETALSQEGRVLIHA